MNRRYFPLAAPARMSAQRAAAATPPATAAAPARAAAVPARAAALAVRGGGAGRRGGCSFGMVVVEAARRGKQLGEVHGFAAAAVEFVDLGTAAESVGEDHRARRGFPQPGQQGALAQASLTSPWQTWKPKLPARLQQPVSRCSARAPAAVRSFSSASQPSTACWWQCTWVSTDAPR
jgi:hypothetical protein